MNREHKEKAVSLLIQEGLSQNSSLKLLEYPKSTFYYKSKPPDTDTIDEIRRLAFRRKRDGYRRIYKKIRRSGKIVNHKKIYRLYRLEGLKIRTKSNKRKKTIPSKPLELPTKSNQVWSMDFVFERTLDQRKQRILTGIDHFSREYSILHVEYSFSSLKLIQFLDSLENLPRSFVLDNGTEFTSTAFREWAENKGIDIHFIDKGKLTQNAFIESFNGKLRDECLNLNLFKNQNELSKALEIYQKDYNEERLHSSLNYLTPLEYKLKFG
ncbi:IS3 family transposase [Leptospira sp. GIMC2001]|uniref:IS3 family transposase n=1 Tax=Leptospira sp. GIMC2001 TaxID=1513297 RepID=UPI00234ACAC4|nr:IS3 family transposase [Leptospira sp. GIMC2001]WCL50656.1 IS3 family transposase [Leptospira sp. GIMC2001]WCL50798.1 IS3 family transposase [Leptospira sp. GIMC2001]